MTEERIHFDPVLLSQARLGVISVLISRRECVFSDLKAILDLTQGNLGIHLMKLEEAGYITVKKEFVRRKPQTKYRITKKGRQAFLEHVEKLNQISKRQKAD